MVVERFRRAQEQKKGGEYEQSPEAVPPSLAEILKDPKLSELLNLALEKDNKQKLIEKLLKREAFSENELEELNNYRILLKEAIDKSQEVLSLLTPETIKIIVGSSNKFKKLVGTLGIENTKKLLEVYLSRLYIVGKDRFDSLAEKIQQIKEAERQLSNIDEQLKEACRRYGISEPELGRLYERIAKGEVKEDEITNLVKRRLNILQKIWDFLQGGTYSQKRVDELNKITEVQTHLNTIYDNLKEVGEMIANVIYTTNGGIDILNKALWDEFKPLGQGLSFKEAFYSPEELEEEWSEFLQEQKVTNWEQLEEERKNELKSGFKSRMRNKLGNKFGNKFGGVLDALINMVAGWADSK